MNANDVNRRELSDSEADLELLDGFYTGVYVSEFPDPDERESRENMQRYLALKRQGWYGTNNYHILTLLEEGRLIAASIVDYLERPNVGVIEFLIVDARRRRARLGESMHRWTLETLTTDARAAGHDGLFGIVAEMNDPFTTDPRADRMDPFVRACVWDRWGYGRLCFPYVQPSLAPGKKPVENLLLLFKPMAGAEAPDCARVTLMLHEYLRLAMRISEPERDPEFVRMKRWLERRDTVPLDSLADYVGENRSRPFHVHRIGSLDEPRYRETLALYERTFKQSELAVSRQTFARLLNQGPDGAAYHLWSLQLEPGARTEGMASFFTLAGAGFLGYVALEGRLRGTGRLRGLIARIERAMIGDGMGAQGSYAECVGNSPAARALEACGFRPIDVPYVQPPLPDRVVRSTSEVPLTLYHKAFGASSEAQPSRATLTHDLEQIDRVVYGLDAPRTARHLDTVLGGAPRDAKPSGG